MRYLIEPRDRIYVKGYGFISFTKNIGKTFSSIYSQNIIHRAKKFATDAVKTGSQRAIQKTAEAAGDLVGNKIADKITSVSKKLLRTYLLLMKIQNYPLVKKRYISLKERQQIIDELRLVPKNY